MTGITTGDASPSIAVPGQVLLTTGSEASSDLLVESAKRYSLLEKETDLGDVVGLTGVLLPTRWLRAPSPDENLSVELPLPP